MKDPIERLKPHIDIILELDRPALLLYLMVLHNCDATGYCQRLRWIAAVSGLSHDEAKAAISLLVSKGFVNPVTVPDDFGSRTDCRVPGYLPFLQDRLPSYQWAALREQVFARDNYTCQYCDVQGGDLECDHVVAIADGGTNELGNLATACAACNRNKRAIPLSRWKGRARD